MIHSKIKNDFKMFKELLKIKTRTYKLIEN